MACDRAILFAKQQTNREFIRILISF